MKLGYMLFYVKDVEKSLEFYEGAFGLVRKFYSKENDQAYGEMDTGETTIGFVSYGLAKAQGIEFSPADPKAKPQAFDIGFVAADVPAAYERAIDHGAVAVSPPEDKPWGQTVSYVRELNGFLVGINSEIKKSP